jgi:branched-subunit amino acid transport protein
MADWDIWLVIAVLGLATLVARSGFWLVGHRVPIPPRVQAMLRYAPACALAAIIGPDLALGPQGELQLGLDNPKLVGGLAALGFYVWRRNMLETLVFGMLAFTLLRVFHVFG